MAALSVSGFPAGQFAFLGFPPRSGSARRNWLARAKAEKSVVVLFEAPHRIRETLSELAALFVKRPIQAHRELTKINEELVIYTIDDDEQRVKELGEFVIVVGEARENPKKRSDDQPTASAVAMVGCMTSLDTFSNEDALALAAKAFDLEVQIVRKAVKKHKIAENQRRQSLP